MSRQIVFKPITLENLHEEISTYVAENSMIISTYEDMIETYLSMLRKKYVFLIDRIILRDIMIDMTYSYCPGDDMNKDRVLEVFDDEEDEDDEEEENDSIPVPQP